MASETEIANLALVKLGDEGQISSLQEDTRAARSIAAVFEAERDALLRAHPWDFARARALLASDPAGVAWGEWTAYPKPADFLRFVEEKDGQDYLLEGRHILARQAADAPLALLYIRRVTETGDFDPLFVDALAWRLARTIAFQLTGTAAVQERMNEGYERAMGMARRVNGQEDAPMELAQSGWTLARERA